jgi:hypothetical protein
LELKNDIQSKVRFDLDQQQREYFLHQQMKTIQEELGGVSYEQEIEEKSVSQKQQEFFGVVRAMQKGKLPKKGKAGEAADEMSKKDVKDFASTKHKGLKNKVEDTDEDVKKLEENILKLVEKHLNPETTKGELLKVLKRK